MTRGKPRHSATSIIAQRHRGRIQLSLLLLLFLVGVVPLLWTSYQLVTRARETMELDQKAAQLDKARSLSQQVGVYVGSLVGQITAIARTLEVDSGARRFPARVRRIREAKDLARYVGDDSPFMYISAVDYKGEGARSGFQLPDRPIQDALTQGWLRGREGQSMLSRPIFSESLKEPVLVLSEPVAPGKNKAQGVILAVASLGPLWHMASELAQGGVMDVYIVDGRGHLVAHSESARVVEDPDFSDVAIVKKFIETKGLFSTTEPFSVQDEQGRTIKMLGTYTRVPDTGWGVIVQVDQAKAYYSAIEMRNTSMGLVAIVVLSAAILGTLFARQISNPIQQLARSARRMAGGDYSTRVRVRSRNEVGVLADSFNHMGAEIEKAMEEIRKQAKINHELFMGSIRMLANAIDEKDPYTRGHSERVAYYAKIMAKHMGMSPEEVDRVHLSGLIHDVGKIGIEDKILRKAAALTDEEYEMMKEHPRKGEHILNAVPMLKSMAGAGLMHHENYDGSGYPDGLRGHDIPLLGRIVSVADAFDAMTTDRPYSKGMTFEEALARLRFLAAKKFDPVCVDAIERASAAGDLTPAKARLASLGARKATLSGAADEGPDASGKGNGVADVATSPVSAS